MHLLSLTWHTKEFAERIPALAHLEDQQFVSRDRGLDLFNVCVKVLDCLVLVLKVSVEWIDIPDEVHKFCKLPHQRKNVLQHLDRPILAHTMDGVAG